MVVELQQFSWTVVQSVLTYILDIHRLILLAVRRHRFSVLSSKKMFLCTTITTRTSESVPLIYVSLPMSGRYVR